MNSMMTWHALPADGRLVQRPAAEVAQLRGQPVFEAAQLPISRGQPARVTGLGNCRFDLSFTLERSEEGTSGVVLRSWLLAGPGATEPCAAALVVDWQRQRLEVGVGALCLSVRRCLRAGPQCVGYLAALLLPGVGREFICGHVGIVSAKRLWLFIA